MLIFSHNNGEFETRRPLPVWVLGTPREIRLTMWNGISFSCVSKPLEPDKFIYPVQHTTRQERSPLDAEDVRVH